MAAVHHNPHSRLASSSDPFDDARKPARRPPPPPPKAAPPTSAKMSSAPNEVRDAVRDTVTYRSSVERHRPSRSHTTAVPPVQNNSTRPGVRRSHSEDRGPVVEKSKNSGGKSRSKKGSQHADVIDRLDFTGVGPMFHHDGPFDACAPSRNKQKSKAPVYSWTPAELAQQSAGNGAYPSAYAYQAFSNDYPEPPKKKVDAIAEAWGIHEPEPFEEFFAGGGSGKQEVDTPASSIYNGKSSARRSKDETKDRARGNSVRRPGVPPPQPIFVPDTTEAVDSQTGSPPMGSPGFPKRSKSLMQRIRKMRDSPNVPVAEYETPPSLSTGAPPGDGYSRPTHKSQHSFLGRFGVKSNQSGPLPSHYEATEPYIFIDNQNTSNQDKALPETPRGRSNSYASENAMPELGYASAQPSQHPGGTQLGRKTSLIKRVGRAVRGR